MPVEVHLPTRIRVDPDALFERRADLEEALLAAAGRALANSREVVLTRRGGYVGVQLHPPTFIWRGEGLPVVPDTLRAEVEAGLLAVLLRAVQVAKIGGQKQPGIGILARDIAETLEEARYDDRLETYEIPLYDDKGQPRPVPIKEKSPASGADQQKIIKRNIQRLNEKDGGLLFATLLLSTRPGATPHTDGSLDLEILKQYARWNPKRFRELLQSIMTEGVPVITKLFQRTEANFTLLTDAFVYLDAVTDAIRLAKEIPQARVVLDAQERKTAGIQRLLGLVDALVELRLKLHNYLKASKEKTSDATLTTLQAIINTLPRISSTFVALAGHAQAEKMIYGLQEDLLDNYRWVSNALEKINEIDTRVALYRLFYGNLADQQEEVQALLAARDLYLSHLTQNPLPTVARVKTLLEEANKFYDDWRGRAGDKKLEKLEAGLKELKKIMGTLGYSAYGDYFREIDHKFNRQVDDMRKTVADLEKKVTGAGSQPRDERYLNAVLELEQQLPLTTVKASLMTFWRAALMVTVDAGWYDVGSRSDRAGWGQRAAAVREEAIKQYNDPDFTKLQTQMEAWQKELEAIAKDIQKTAKREFWINLGITAVAIIVTAGAGGFLAGARVSMLTITITEAATFTAVTTVGRGLVLGKSIDPGDVIGEFAGNVVLFGAFKGLNIGLVAGARALAPGRALAQMGIIFGANALVTTGVPLLITRLETGKWPEDMGTFILGGLMLNALGALLTGPKLLEGLRAQNRVDVISKLQSLSAENAELTAEARAVLAKGSITEEQFKSIQTRAAKIYSDLEAALKQMAGRDFSDAHLSALKLTRTQVQELAQMAAEYAAAIKGATYRPVVNVRALPPPGEVIGTGLVVRGNDSFEYNPFVPEQSPEKMTLLLKRAGYDVTDTGGGVLRLAGPQGAPVYLLLPARASVAPPALADLVGKPGTQTHKGLMIVQQQANAAKLVAQLTATAQTASPETAQKLLRAIGRFLKPEHTEELKGLSHFLEVGGKPETLAKALTPAETQEWSDTVRKMLRVFNRFDQEAAQGLETFFTLRPGLTAISALRVVANFEPAQLDGIFGLLQRLSSRSEGLGNLIPGLRGDNPQMYKGVIGVLTVANQEVTRFPDARLIFEDPILTGEGKVIRITDIRVVRPNVSSSRRVEVKEIYKLSSLGSHAVRELANDIVDDAKVRQTLPTPAGGARPFFETIAWRIRYAELAEAAAKRLKLTDVNDPAVRKQVVDDVKARLKPAFDHAIVKKAVSDGVMSQTELDGYQKAFEAGLPFVEFF